MKQGYVMIRVNQTHVNLTHKPIAHLGTENSENVSPTKTRQLVVEVSVSMLVPKESALVVT